MKEVINNKCFIRETGSPLKYIMQYLWDFTLKPRVRDNHFISYTPDDRDKQNKNLVAIFRITKLKINQNVQPNL